MSDFICGNFDYVDYIRNEEDMKLFNRMVELQPALAKPLRECIKEFQEVAKIHYKLLRLPEPKFMILNNPNFN